MFRTSRRAVTGGNERTQPDMKLGNRTTRLPMKVWDMPTRLFHWAIVLLIGSSYFTIKFRSTTLVSPVAIRTPARSATARMLAQTRRSTSSGRPSSSTMPQDR